jgi:hypothetical protein
MTQPVAKPTFSRELRAKIRRRAHTLSLLSYEHLVTSIELDLIAGKITPERIDSWMPPKSEGLE